MEKIKVLHVMSGYGGGISSFIKNKAEALKDQAVLFDVATYDDCPEDFVQAIQATGGDVYTLVNPKRVGWRRFSESFQRALKANDHDVVYCHVDGYRSQPYHYLTKKNGKAKFYIHAHSAIPEELLTVKSKVDQALTSRNSEANVGCSDQALLSIYGKKAVREKRVIIPNSISVEDFVKTPRQYKLLRQENREKYKIRPDELVIGQIGRLHPVKNHQLTMDLAAFMQENKLAGRFLFIGAGDEEEAYKSQVAKRGLVNIEFVGRISPIADFFPTLDVLLLPSHYEGLPTTIIESQAAGVPAILSDTITQEVDLGLGMVDYLPLDAPMEDWYQAIIAASQKTIPSALSREEVIQNKNFSNQDSAQLFEDFLRGRLTHYTLT